MSEVSEKISAACPQCKRQFRLARTMEGKQGRCPCGVQFTIRDTAADVVVAALVEPPSEDSYSVAGGIGTPVEAEWQSAEIAAPSAVPSWIPGPPGPAAIPGMKCQRHPDVPATARCTRCGGTFCSTCIFPFLGGAQFCPACVVVPPGLSSRRKMMLTWALILAAAATFIDALLLSGALMEFVSNPAGDFVITALVAMLGTGGLGLAGGSVERRAGNPVLVWVAVAWNSITCGFWVFIMVLAAMMASGGGRFR